MGRQRVQAEGLKGLSISALEEILSDVNVLPADFVLQLQADRGQRQKLLGLLAPLLGHESEKIRDLTLNLLKQLPVPELPNVVLQALKAQPQAQAGETFSLLLLNAQLEPILTDLPAADWPADLTDKLFNLAQSRFEYTGRQAQLTLTHLQARGLLSPEQSQALESLSRTLFQQGESFQKYEALESLRVLKALTPEEETEALQFLRSHLAELTHNSQEQGRRALELLVEMGSLEDVSTLLQATASLKAEEAEFKVQEAVLKHMLAAPEQAEELEFVLQRLLKPPALRLEQIQAFAATLKTGHQPEQLAAFGTLNAQEKAQILQLESQSILQNGPRELKGLVVLHNFRPEQIKPAHFETLRAALEVYVQSPWQAELPLKPEVLANLEGLFLQRALFEPASGAGRSLAALAHARRHRSGSGSAAGIHQLAQLPLQGQLLQTLPEATQRQLQANLQRFLALSGSDFQVQGLDPASLSAAVRELEARLGLEVTGAVTVENLRQLERAQKNYFVVMVNARNILHDELLATEPHQTPEAQAARKTAELQALLGNGELITPEEALRDSNLASLLWRLYPPLL